MMRSTLWQFAHLLTAAILILAFATPPPSWPKTTQHLVSPADLQKAAVDALANQATKHRHPQQLPLYSDQAQQALQSAHVSPQQVKKAVAGMSDEELAQLASRAQKAQSDFAAGTMATATCAHRARASSLLISSSLIFH